MTYYLAASFFRRTEAVALRDKIADALPGLRCISSWLDADTGADYVVDSVKAERDFGEVIQAGFLVLMTDGAEQKTRGGRHTELGLSIALDRPVYAVGPKEQVFHHYPSIRWFDHADTMILAISMVYGNLPVESGHRPMLINCPPLCHKCYRCHHSTQSCGR
jgi:nucleoside 2-deoxyribosyltransferase